MNGPPFDQSYLESLDDFGEPGATKAEAIGRRELKIFSAESLARTSAPDRRWLVPNMIATLADVYGGDENIRSQVRQFLGFLTGLAIKHDMAVVVLAHPSLSGITSGTGTGGSTAWNNSVRSRLYLSPMKSRDGNEPDPSLKQLTVMKSNYGPAGETIPLRWERGRFVLAGSDWKSSLSNAETDKLFTELLEQFTREGRNVTTKKGTSYAPSEFASHADAKGVGKDAFKKAMDRLLSAGKIENIETGSPSRRRSRLVAVSEDDEEF